MGELHIRQKWNCTYRRYLVSFLNSIFTLYRLSREPVSINLMRRGDRRLLCKCVFKNERKCVHWRYKYPPFLIVFLLLLFLHSKIAQRRLSAKQLVSSRQDRSRVGETAHNRGTHATRPLRTSTRFFCFMILPYTLTSFFLYRDACSCRRRFDDNDLKDVQVK